LSDKTRAVDIDAKASHSRRDSRQKDGATDVQLLDDAREAVAW